MQANLKFNNKNYQVDLKRPIDISIPLTPNTKGVNCFYAPDFVAEPVRAGDFIGSTKEGGPVNFMNLQINPHGNGTHTECVGHIATETYTIHDCLKEFHFIAKLVEVNYASKRNGDRYIPKTFLEALIEPGEVEALIIRTLPNEEEKQQLNYSGTNPIYFIPDAIEYLVACGIKHLLVDIPSIDKEEDGGAVLAHHVFWQYPQAVRKDCTITELIYVPNEIEQGYYFLNIQIASLKVDVSPSKICIYRLKEIE